MPEGAVAIDVHISGAYLDAKNRAADLLGEDGPADRFDPLADDWRTAREATVRSVAPADVDRLRFYGERLTEALAEQMDRQGASELAADLQLLLQGPRGAVDPAPMVKVWSDIAAGVAPGPAFGEVLWETKTACETVLGEPLPRSGPLADDILVAADSELAPATSRDTDAFEPEPALDATASAEGDLLPNLTLARAGVGEPPGLSWTGADGTKTSAPDTWPAFSSPTRRIYWLAGEGGEVALSDGALRGWAYRIERSVLVDAHHIGRALAVFDME
jgi:hypothetical protein